MNVSKYMIIVYTVCCIASIVCVLVKIIDSSLTINFLCSMIAIFLVNLLLIWLEVKEIGDKYKKRYRVCFRKKKKITQN